MYGYGVSSGASPNGFAVGNKGMVPRRADRSEGDGVGDGDEETVDRSGPDADGDVAPSPVQAANRRTAAEQQIATRASSDTTSEHTYDPVQGARHARRAELDAPPFVARGWGQYRYRRSLTNSYRCQILPSPQ